MPYSDNFVRDTLVSVTKEGGFYRVSWSRSCRKPGYVAIDDKWKKSRVNSGDSHRLEASILRSKSLVRQYARCNDWDYFVTFTINPSLWDSFDLRTFYFFT